MNLNKDTNTDELDCAKKTEEPVKGLPHHESDIPLFVRDTSEGQKGNAQDEKDKTGE